MLDPETMKYHFVDTCFGTHHPQFGYDADNTLWFSGTGQVAGWVNTKIWDETGDAQKAQGWAPFVLDINGNGTLDEWIGRRQAGRARQGHPLQSGLRSLRGDAASDRRLGLVHRRRVRGPAGLHALRSEDEAERVLRGPEGGHRLARRRHRQERRAVGLGLERPSDQRSTAASARRR